MDSGTCRACGDLAALPAFTFAFQPIVDVRRGEIFSYEALVRGSRGESAGSILAQIDERCRYAFDQACRVKAITLASTLGMRSRLNINFMPNAVYRAVRCIATTVATAARLGFPLERLVFEVTEGERVEDADHLRSVLAEYRRMGLGTAIDDFGAGFAGLGLLADFQPDFLKLDIALVRAVDHDRARQAIVRGVIRTCLDLGIAIVAEGVETAAEFSWLEAEGVDLFQGYYFARPAFEALPEVRLQRAS